LVRALDRAGIAVDDVEVHQPSLDDVFFALTGHPSSDAGDDGDDEGPVGPEERQSAPVGSLR
jgi:ABC-2 type transport system ATP-binding protein